MSDNPSDHDLLIALNTKMEMLLVNQQQFTNSWAKMLERITAMEIEQSRHSEKVRAIQGDVEDSRKKGNIVDVINAAIAAAAAALAYFFTR